MPISLKNTSSILPYIRYSPQANVMSTAGEDNKPREIPFIDKAVAYDPENGTRGHLLISAGVRDWKPFAKDASVPDSPGHEYKLGFAIMAYAPKLFGTPEAHEMCASTASHLSFCQRLYNECEPNFGKGTVPVVKITEAELIQVGKGKSRELHFEITKWIPRPAAFTEALAKLKAAAGGAPGKSAGGAPDAGDDFDDDDVTAPKGKPKPDGGDDIGGAAASPEEEPKPETTAKAKKRRGKAQSKAAPPHSSDILDDPIPFSG